MPYKYKILSIDGGGIRGIIPAIILAEIEQETGKPIFEMFDLIAGTSTGGILALSLTKPNPVQPHNAHYPAKELVKLYEEKGHEIFSKPTIKKLADAWVNEIREHLHIHFPEVNIKSLFGSRYSSDGREKVLQEKLDNTQLEDALTEVFVTSYDTQLRLPIFFTSNKERQNNIAESYRVLCHNISMLEAAMATSAAPTYFPPYKLNQKPEPVEPTQDYNYYCLIDGGVFANNPTTMGIIDIMINHHNQYGERLQLSDILVVSLGTGSLMRPYKYDQVNRWGELQWALPVFDIVLDGQSESIACQLDRLLPKAESKPKQYYRFQSQLNNPNDDIDDTSSENIQKLKDLAIQIIKNKKQKKPTPIHQWDNDWDEMCGQLLEPKEQ